MVLVQSAFSSLFRSRNSFLADVTVWITFFKKIKNKKKICTKAWRIYREKGMKKQVHLRILMEIQAAYFEILTQSCSFTQQ